MNKLKALINIAKDRENNKINKFFNSIGFIILLGVLLFIKTIFFYKNTIANTDSIELQTIFGTIFFIVVYVCIICTLPNKSRIIIGIISTLVISLLLFMDNIYYIFSNNVLSVAQITNLQYGEEIADTLPTVLEGKQILYFIDIIFFVILIISKFLVIVSKPKKTKKERIKKILTGISIALIGCILSIGYVQNGKQKSYNKDLQIKEATIYGYHIYDIENVLNTKKNTKYKTKDKILEDYTILKEEYNKEGSENLKGVINGKNIIILQLESVQEFLLNQSINGKEITPNLNGFMNENIEFTNMFMQSYSTTADCEHSSITSLYPMENGMSYSKYYTNTYDDLFKIFHKNNYHTSYMHGNYPYFWNRGNVYGRMEIDELSLKEQFEDLSENINGDLSDELLYLQAVDKLKTYNEPFISYIVSASSHTPFTLEGLQDKSKISIDVGKYKNTYFGNYLEAMNYADYAFGVFINKLKEEGLYNDTTILVFGDHNGLTMYQDEMVEFLKERDPNINDVDLKLNYIRVACGIKIPGMQKQKIYKPVSKLDIKPTLTNLVGIDDGISLGTNMFALKQFVCLNNERIVTDKYYYDEQWYDINTGETIIFDMLEDSEKQELNTYYNSMKTELDISESISVNNLLK